MVDLVLTMVVVLLHQMVDLVVVDLEVMLVVLEPLVKVITVVLEVEILQKVLAVAVEVKKLSDKVPHLFTEEELVEVV